MEKQIIKEKKLGFGIQKWKDESIFKGNLRKIKAKGWRTFNHSQGNIHKGI